MALGKKVFFLMYHPLATTAVGHGRCPPTTRTGYVYTTPAVLHQYMRPLTTSRNAPATIGDGCYDSARLPTFSPMLARCAVPAFVREVLFR